MILIGLIATVFFKKQSISNNLSLLEYLQNVIKTLETVNFLSFISIVSLSLNDDLTKIKSEIYCFERFYNNYF